MKQKILVIRFSSIGDIVLTSPIVRCLKKQTDAEIHFVVKNQYSTIVSHNPYIDKIYSFDKSIMEISEQMNSEKYDVIIDLHKNIRSRQLLSKLNHRGLKHFSFPKLNIRKWFYVRFGMNVLPDIHIVDRYFKAVKSQNVINDNKGLDFFYSNEDKIDVTSLGKWFGLNYAVFTLGAQFKTKCLPLPQMTLLIQSLEIPVVLLGGEEDQELGNLLQALLGSRVLNLAGKLSLGQSASLIEQSSVVLAHDTGLMHIAAAFKKPIGVIWGNTTPKFGMYAYQSDAQTQNFEVQNLSCRPCSKIGFQECPKEHFKCMNNQNIIEIASFANQFK